MKTEDSDCARSLRSTEVAALRRGMLHEPHIAPLTDFVIKLRETHPASEFPDFDPLDGGSAADILFLLEKPGPKTSAKGGGSGFISRNNDDPTAEATFGFMKEAGIARKRTVAWNVIPGWNETIKVTTNELRAGIEALKGLLPLLPKLRTIILVGKKAQRARPLVEPLGCRIFVSAHPSPRVRASQPDIWRAIPSIWAQAAQLGMIDEPRWANDPLPGFKPDGTSMIVKSRDEIQWPKIIGADGKLYSEEEWEAKFSPEDDPEP